MQNISENKSVKSEIKSLKLKFQTVVEKTAKNFRGLLYFAAPDRMILSDC